MFHTYIQQNNHVNKFIKKNLSDRKNLPPPHMSYNLFFQFDYKLWSSCQIVKYFKSFRKDGMGT